MRMEEHPVLGRIVRGRLVTILVDGAPVPAHEGESLAVALMAAGHDSFGQTEKMGRPRGLYCGDGTCGECRCRVDGVPKVRACITPVRDGMSVVLAPEVKP